VSFWPPPYLTAISLSFDDGLPSHLSVAIPELNRRGLHGTFYLNPRGRKEDAARSLSWADWLAQWQSAHAAGHELGNHTLAHPCFLNRRWPTGSALQDWSLADMETDVLEAQRRLTLAFPAQRLTSFAYPCYETNVGRGVGRVSYTPLIARHFAAGRARGENRAELANDPECCDVFHLSSWTVERQAGAFMVGLVEQAAALGYWGIFTFHGIQEGHLPVGDTDLMELLDHLARRSGTIWIATVAEIGAYVTARQAGLAAR
jgi:hypothetical protein